MPVGTNPYRRRRSVGDSVAAGAALLVLEAMKMEHALTARAAGKVKAVHVEAGVQVAPGRLLVELDPA